MKPAIAFAMALLVCGCLSQQQLPAGVRVIPPDEFKEYIEEDDVFLLDAYKGEHEMIPGTDAHIPYDRIEGDSGQLPAEKNTPIAVYCRLDPMSDKAVEKLAELGYTNVTKMRGGTTAWEARGYPLE